VYNLDINQKMILKWILEKWVEDVNWMKLVYISVQ
jgi:hypothetical protein